VAGATERGRKLPWSAPRRGTPQANPAAGTSGASSANQREGRKHQGTQRGAAGNKAEPTLQAVSLLHTWQLTFLVYQFRWEQARSRLGLSKGS
jgi:hypothetical protein